VDPWNLQNAFPLLGIALPSCSKTIVAQFEKHYPLLSLWALQTTISSQAELELAPVKSRILADQKYGFT
jgi:hypothetical protein